MFIEVSTEWVICMETSSSSSYCYAPEMSLILLNVTAFLPHVYVITEGNVRSHLAPIGMMCRCYHKA